MADLRVLVTGSSGHLGEALVRTLRARGAAVVGLDLAPSPHTDCVGSVSDRAIVHECMRGVDVVLHTATLHKPHVVTHAKQAFVDTNVSGTLALLEEAVRCGVGAFVFTSSTSVFGDALRPAASLPAAWITEAVEPIPKNIYGITKIAAEDLCRLFWKRHGLSCVVLRTSRFFPEEDDDAAIRHGYADANVKTNEYLFRRAELQDIVDAHLLALEKAHAIGFDKLIVSATTPFRCADAQALRDDAPAVAARLVPEHVELYRRLGWRMFPSVDRVYVNEKARRVLAWNPRWDFAHVVDCLRRGDDPRSPLARLVGSKGYHAQTFERGPYPVE